MRATLARYSTGKTHLKPVVSAVYGANNYIFLGAATAVADMGASVTDCGFFCTGYYATPAGWRVVGVAFGVGVAALYRGGLVPLIW